MNEIFIIKIIFGILLSLGAFVLFLLSFLLYYKYLVQEKKCIAKTKGVVKKYTLATRGGENSGVHLPIVYYNVNGKEYKVIGPEYKNYVIITSKSPFRLNQEVYKEENQVLIINKCANSFMELRNHIMEYIYPIGTEIDVFYDPQHPKSSYVLRYCNKKSNFLLMFFSGIQLLIFDLAILFLLG